MELIIPFVKYSLSFRRAANCSSKRTDIYNKWKKCVLNTKHNVTSNRFEHDAICDFCYAKNQSYFCTKCLYPIFCERNVERELAMYAMISMCFWETVSCDNDHNDDDDDSSAATSETTKFVWRQRLKTIWDQHADNYRHERETFRFAEMCIQCNRLTDNKNSDIDFIKFNVHLFCNECLFPLFYVNCNNK
ncbi:ac52 [Malacosoma neustria nucleopolyhedrovirus]|uniref:ac52 n=1 Tax=Malacosoma neustria nuclear polyhedrosis virus TaxID=38012 RepID=UPI000E35D27C|nr:ac52 [Malacosoma neustria nucleopolyhedrovirus]AUF81566.1 ac52 [Malacosoma neustria nucleopolyhedrovirus]